MNKIIVFGSSGVLGNIIVNQVRTQFGDESLIISDYSSKRAENLSKSLNLSNKPRVIDVNDVSSIKSNLDNIDAALIATKQENSLIQQECIKRGIVTVDVTVFKKFVEKVQKLENLARNNSVPTLIMAGYFPGLSGISVNELVNYFDTLQEIQVSLLQNTKASAGKYGFTDMLNIINNEIITNEGTIKGFTVKNQFYHDDYSKVFKQYRIKSDEAEILSEKYELDIGYYTGWEKESFNLFIKFLNRMGLSQFLANNPLGIKLSSIVHPPKKYVETNHEITSLAIIGAGYKNKNFEEKSIYINAKADYLATAIAATTMLKLILQKREQFKGGVFFPYQLFDLNMLKEHFVSSEIDIIGV